MNDENIFDILRIGEYRPSYYRQVIDEYLESKYIGRNDWQHVTKHDMFNNKLFETELKHYDHQYTHTHHLRIDVYYDYNKESTIVSLHIREKDIMDEIVSNNYSVMLQTIIMPNDNVLANSFISVFDEVFTDLHNSCSAIEYRLEYGE